MIFLGVFFFARVSQNFLIARIDNKAFFVISSSDFSSKTAKNSSQFSSPECPLRYAFITGKLIPAKHD